MSKTSRTTRVPTTVFRLVNSSGCSSTSAAINSFPLDLSHVQYQVGNLKRGINSRITVSVQDVLALPAALVAIQE